MDREAYDMPGYRQQIRVQPIGPDIADQPGPERLSDRDRPDRDGADTEDAGRGDQKRKKKHRRRHHHKSRRQDAAAATVADEADEPEDDADTAQLRAAGAAADNAAFRESSVDADGSARRPTEPRDHYVASPRQHQHHQHHHHQHTATAGATVAPSPLPSGRLSTRQSKLDQQLPMDEFVKHSINMRLCNRYIPNQADVTTCHCNRPPEWHRERGIPVDESPAVKVKWKTDSCAQTVPSNGYGRMKLQGFGRIGVNHKPYYIRIDSETRDFEALWELMTSPKYWNLPTPDLVLSVSGGAKKMEKMSAKLLKKVKHGLTSVASGVKTTWILTPGFNLGCSQLVGQAIQEYRFAGGSQQIWVIGVCSWGAVYNRECLEISNNTQRGVEQLEVVEYANCTENPGRGQAAIEPNHTHFILCDNGTLKYFGTEIDFRAEFEQFVVHKLKSLTMDVKDAFNPPVVQMVIEGGKKAVLMAGRAAEAGTPVVVVQGSGRAANELAFFRNIRSLFRGADDDFVKRKIEEVLARYQTTWKCNEVEAKEINEILFLFSTEDPSAKFDCNMLSVYNAEQDEDMAKTILYTFFRHKDYKNSTMTQVRLCMAWKRADIAATEIFAEAQKSKWKGMNLQRAMKEALNKQQPDFVKLFLEHGIDLSKFLSIETLAELYAKMFRSGSSQADRLLHKLDRLTCCTYRGVSSYDLLKTSCSDKLDVDIVMSCVNWLIKIYTEHAVDNLYNEENMRDNPMKGASLLARPLIRETIFPPYSKSGKRRFTSQDLFIWSLLIHNVELAILFWKHGKDQIGSALIGYAILNNMAIDAEKRGEMETKEQLTRDAQRFEQLAVGVLEECSKDRTTCRLLLIRSLPYWNHQTVMAIAEANQCMDLLYQTPVQTVLTQTWMGGMEADTANWRLIVSLFLPFLVPMLIFHKHATDEVAAESADVADEEAAGDPGAARDAEDAADTHRRMDPIMKDVELVDVRGPHAREAVEDLQVEAAISDFNKRSKREMRLRKLRHQQRGFRTMHCCTSLLLFYSAPICKFILNVISTSIFLLFFSYVSLVQLHPLERQCPMNATYSTSIPAEVERYIGFPQPHGLEIYMFVWAFTYVAEEFRQFFAKNQPLVKKFGELSYWDKFDMLISILFVVCLVLRLSLPCQHFDWVRNAYALTLASCFVRFMQFYYPSPSLGPKVVMIINMLSDVVFFICILVIFILAYGVAHFSLMTNTDYNYVNKELDFHKIVRGVFYTPYWQMYGELGLDGVDQGIAIDGSRNWLVIFLMAVYMLGTNVLLINLLIAMFGHTFEKVQSESNKFYAYIRHDLIYEYYTRPILPPPLICLPHIWRFVCYIRHKCCDRGCRTAKANKRTYDDFTMEMDVTEHQRLSAIEQQATDRFLRHSPEADDVTRTPVAAPGESQVWDGGRAGGVGGGSEQDGSELREKLLELEDKFGKIEEQMKSVTENSSKMLQMLEHLSTR